MTIIELIERLTAMREAYGDNVVIKVRNTDGYFDTADAIWFGYISSIKKQVIQIET